MKRAALAALLSLSLAACAVPGQNIDPGVAFEADGRVVTFAEVDGIVDAWLHDTQGRDVPHRNQAMTLEAIREPLFEAVQPILDEFDFELSDSVVRQQAETWMLVKGVEDPQVSDTVIDSVRVALALYILVANDAEGTAILDLARTVEQNVEGSPRAGRFDAVTFLTSISTALQNADKQQFGPVSYIEFQNVNGFVDIDTVVRQPENRAG